MKEIEAIKEFMTLSNFRMWSEIFHKSYIRDGSLITFGDGMQDNLIYLMEFSTPSQIYVEILAPTLGLQKKLYAPLKML